MFVNNAVLELGLQPEALFAFFHCQRTGGSNTLRWFDEVFGAANVFSYRTSDRYVPWQSIKDTSVLDGYKLTGGFANYKKLDLNRPLVCISIVRHPFFRTVSLYRLAQMNSDHFVHDVAIQGSFEDFYREGSKRRPKYFHNLACQCMSYSANAEIAIHSMKSTFGMVGTTNRLAEMTALLASVFGWNVAPMAAGQAEPDEVHYQSYLNSPIFEEIMNNNAEDMKLYNFVNTWQVAHVPAAQSVQEKPTETVRFRNSETVGHYEKPDVDFIAFKSEHPDMTFAQYRMERIAQKVRKGASHSTLGANLVDSAGNRKEFWVAGAAVAKKFIKSGNVTPDHRVVEYGCGSLRVGAHFIKYLEPEGFYGVDVVDGFYEIGKTSIGEDLLREKRPRFDVISDATVESLTHFTADFIYSSSVCYHVHPDEIAFYFAALEKITAKPGAVLMFDVKLTDKLTRYTSHSWAWPLEFIKNALPNLEFVEATEPSEITGGGHVVNFSVLKFQRPS